MEFPRSLFSNETRPDPSDSINYSSTFKSLKAVKDVVSAEGWNRLRPQLKGRLRITVMSARVRESNSGKGGKLPLGDILEKTKKSIDEVHPVWEHQDEDPEIDNLLEFLRQDDSLSTITWQALPEYPLTPIKFNKCWLFASRRKSKKSKKVGLGRGQENIGDEGENCGDIAETEEQRLSEKVEILEKQFNSGPVSAVFQSAGGITVDNLASRITQLEEIMQVKTPVHDRFSNTKLPAKQATPTLFSVTEIRRQHRTDYNTRNWWTPGPGKEADKEEGKPVGEVHPDNPEEENAVEEKDEELSFEGECIDVEKSAPQTLRESHPENPEEENGAEDIEEEMAFEGEGVDIDRLLQK
ncbi:hypothetical protein Bca4012_010345 [Brassica carinata]